MRTTLLIGMLSLAATARSAEVVAKFECQERLGHDWPRTLLHYDVDIAPGKLRPDKLELVDAQGQTVECQIVPTGKQQARVSFYTALPQNGAFTYTLQTGKPSAPRVKAERKGAVLEVTTAETGVRLPAPGHKEFKQPVDPKEVPAPILGYRLNNGQWAGKGWLESDRKIASWSQQVVADGPLYKEYAYEVKFAPAGYYRVRVRVEAELPLVQVAEEYDMGEATAGRDFFVLSLNDGWKPDTALWAGSRSPDPKAANVRGRRIEHDSEAWRQPLDFSTDREHNQFYAGPDWGTKAQWYGLFAEAGDPASPFVGIMSEHTGAWRLPDQSLSPILWTKNGEVLAKFRTSINLNGCPVNPFSTAEIDPGLPQTLGRRMWALVLGPRPAADAKPLCATMDLYRSYHGYITLNDYKDWILTWPEKEQQRPCVMTTPELLARLKANLDKCPGKEVLKDTYLISGDPQRALGEARDALTWITQSRLPPMLAYYMTHYRQTESDYASVFRADSALACKELPADTRQILRTRIAAMCYLLSHPDFNVRGSGVHMGNPNMAFNRFMSLPLYAALIRDHPLAKTWLDGAAEYVKWKAGYNCTSGGGMFRECPGYATYGPVTFLTTAAIALRNAGYDLDRYEPLKDFGRYFTDIETAKAAPRGLYRKDHIESAGNRKLRVLPAFGNGVDVAGGQNQMLFANLAAKSDPAYAARMMGGWLEAGTFLGTQMVQPQFWFYWNPDIQPVTPKHEDRIITGFGGVLRAHSETTDETYVALRNGYMQSHWNPDQGTFVLYAHGVCLAPPTGWAYSGTAGLCHDSRICFGEPLADHEHGRVDTNIEDYGSLPSVGYLLGRQTFVKRWDKTKTLRNDFDWSRQVLLVRSPRADGANYVVVRDTTQGACPLPTWWYQWLQAKAENVKPVAGGVQVAVAEGVKLDIQFVEPANPQIGVKPAKVQGFQEDYSQLSVAQPAGPGYLTVFYPSKGTEPGLGKVEKLADGLIKITTPESEDYVFAAVDKPVVFKNELLDINAYAGTVRVFKDKVLLVNASGQRGKVGYKGVVAEGLGPFEHDAAKGSAQIGRAIAKLSKPAGAAVEWNSEGLKGWVQVAGAKVTLVATDGFGTIRSKDFYVKGEAPFTCVYEPGKVTLTAEGRRRIFQMPIPHDIVPANLLPPEDNLPADFRNGRDVGGYLNWPWAIDAKVDGIVTQPGWYNGKMTIGLEDGKHTAVITAYTNPPVWPTNAFTKLLEVSR